MSSIKFMKHICDRCGDSLEIDSASDFSMSEFPYPITWQHMTLGQTGNSLDLCDSCNMDLVKFLSEKGGTNMTTACINKREVL